MARQMPAGTHSLRRQNAFLGNDRGQKGDEMLHEVLRKVFLLTWLLQ